MNKYNKRTANTETKQKSFSNQSFSKRNARQTATTKPRHHTTQHHEQGQTRKSFSNQSFSNKRETKSTFKPLDDETDEQADDEFIISVRCRPRWSGATTTENRDSTQAKCGAVLTYLDKS